MDVLNNNRIIIIIVIVVVSVAVLFTFILVIIVSLYLCYKYKLSSKTSPDGKTVPQSSQSMQPGPVYETVMESTTVDLEMTENVAYAPVRTLKKNTNTTLDQK